MTYDTVKTPDQPHTLDDVKAAFATGSDARWEGVPLTSEPIRVSSIRFSEMRLHVRDHEQGR
jgi:hypothetical protein